MTMRSVHWYVLLLFLALFRQCYSSEPAISNERLAAMIKEGLIEVPKEQLEKAAQLACKNMLAEMEHTCRCVMPATQLNRYLGLLRSVNTNDTSQARRRLQDYIDANLVGINQYFETGKRKPSDMTAAIVKRVYVYRLQHPWVTQNRQLAAAVNRALLWASKLPDRTEP